MRSQKTSTVAAGAMIISIGTLFSRMLGLVRDNMLGNYFPNRLVTDAYRSAFLVPDLLYYLLAGGALSAAFIPVFSGYLAKKQADDANKTASSIINLMLLCITGGLVLLFIFAPEVVRVIAHGYLPGSHKFNLTVMLAREMCVMVIFTALSGLFTGMLQSANHFLTPVIVWNTYSIGIILGIGLFSKMRVPAFIPDFFHWTGPTLGIHGAAMGVVLGAISLAGVQLPVVLKKGFHYSPIIDLSHPGVRKVLMLFGPVMIGLALSQVNLLAIPQIMGSMMPDGAVTDIFNANRLILLPMGLFAIAIATAAFPRLSQQVALGQMTEFRKTVGSSLKVISLLTIPSAIGLMILAEPIASLLYGGKGFGITDIQATAYTLSFFTWGLLALSLMQLINRAFYAQQDTVTPVIIGIGMVATNVLLALVFAKFTPLGYGGISLATSLTSTASTLLLFDILRRKTGGIGGRTILVAIGKICLATVVMGVVVYLVAHLLAPVAQCGKNLYTINPIFPARWPMPDLTARIHDGIHTLPGHLKLRYMLIVQIGAAMACGMVAYAVMLKLLKVEEISAVADRFFGKIRRKRAAAV